MNQKYKKEIELFLKPHFYKKTKVLVDIRTGKELEKPDWTNSCENINEVKFKGESPIKRSLIGTTDLFQTTLDEKLKRHEEQNKGQTKIRKNSNRSTVSNMKAQMANFGKKKKKKSDWDLN